MADETGRVVKRKRIKLPDGNTVDIPVISRISFLDAAERGQETQHTFDNSTDSDRNVRVASVIGNATGKTDETGQGLLGFDDDGNPINDTSQTLQVERLDLFRLSDAAERGQETFQAPDSKTVAQPPDAPPYFTTHAKTHIVKYVKRNEDDDSEDASIWIKSELIDQWSFGDGVDRGQETQWTLSNPPDNQDIKGLRFGTDDKDITTISVDPDVDEITSGVGGSGDDDKPVRTDPFQNIVDFSGHPFTVFWYYYRRNNTVVNISGDPNFGYRIGNVQFRDAVFALVPGSPDVPSGYVVGGGTPTIGSISASTDGFYEWITPGDVAPIPGYESHIGTTSVSGTAQVGFNPTPGIFPYSSTTPLQASLSNPTLTKDGQPWVLHAMELRFYAVLGPPGAAPPILFGNFPDQPQQEHDWIVFEATFVPG